MNVINLGNSIIGVSILAMPYCFRKCGILLSLLLIIMSGFLVRSACYLLLKAAIMARRRNFEFLAFHTFGSTGKLAVEIGIIGFLIGVCIAFFVVIGDLGPPLVAECLLVENTPNLRAEVLVCLGLFVALPLGLLRKVDSLTSCSALSIAFYGFLVLKIISEALPKLMINEWWYEVNWWQPSGLLPCLPIFSMALSCQTQLFEFFDTLSDPSLKRMTAVISGAVHLCSAVYILVGTFGYIAFHDKLITGNILVRLSPSVMTEFIKLGFIITVAISFPLCLFPCRTSLHSLLFKQGVSHHDIGVNFIPDRHFRALTISLVSITIGIAIMLPNIEFVLGIIGSTIGTMVCLILPAIIFVHGTNKNSAEKLKAQCVMLVGMFILVACTYSTLSENKETRAHLPETVNVEKHVTERPFTSMIPVASLPSVLKVDDKKNPEKFVLNNQKAKIKEITDKSNKSSKDADQKRQEPPVPQEPEIKAPQEPEVKEIKAPPESEVKEIKVVKAEPNVDLDPQALQKEDKELQKDVPKSSSSASVPAGNKVELDKQEQLLRKLEAQHKEQKKLLEEQKKLLEELKQHKQSHNEIEKIQSVSPQNVKIHPPQNVKLLEEKEIPIVITNDKTDVKEGGVKKAEDGVKPVDLSNDLGVLTEKKSPKDLHNPISAANQNENIINNSNISYKNTGNLNFDSKKESNVINQYVKPVASAKLPPDETKELQFKVEKSVLSVQNATRKKTVSAIPQQPILSPDVQIVKKPVLEKQDGLQKELKKELPQPAIEKREVNLKDLAADTSVNKKYENIDAMNKRSIGSDMLPSSPAVLVSDKQKVVLDSGKREMRKL